MSISVLIGVFEQLLPIHDELLELGRQKTQVLIRNDVDQLNRIVNKESVLMRQITKLDRARVEAINGFLAEKCYKPVPNITVSELSKLIFNIEDRQSLDKAQSELAARIEKLREINDRNKQLIEDALAYIDFSLDLFIGPSAEEPVYQKPAAPSQGMSRLNLFDTRG